MGGRAPWCPATPSATSARPCAADLGLSPNTIGTHVRSSFAELGIHSRVQLANALHRREAELSGRSPAPPGTPD
ncbi:LuxR C-terminal-related transcriptional regulator [Streptomyces sp. RLB1-33]|nr:response regulator transcription factor [Streptomyces sp. RLB1-33]